MIIYPAIDIKEGKVVRLHQGKFDEVTEYSESPVDMAKKWQEEGAEWLHVVDLDGALSGETKNHETVLEIAKAVDIPVQTGGGIRSIDTVANLIDGGVKRVILGTKVIEDQEFFKDVLDHWKENIAVSLDCSRGFVVQRGWTTMSDVKAVDLVKELEKMGLSCLIYTDIARDGTMRGPNLHGLIEILHATNIPVIASGGISSLEDIKALAALADEGVSGAITGKAIYEGALNLKEAIEHAH